MDSGQTAVLVGAGQLTQREAEPKRALSPPELMAEAARRAARDAVVFERDGSPSRGIVVGRLADGRRFLANTPDDRTLVEALVATEAVGHAGIVSSSGGVNLFHPA